MLTSTQKRTKQQSRHHGPNENTNHQYKKQRLTKVNLKRNVHSHSLTPSQSTTTSDPTTTQTQSRQITIGSIQQHTQQYQPAPSLQQQSQQYQQSQQSQQFPRYQQHQSSQHSTHYPPHRPALHPPDPSPQPTRQDELYASKTHSISTISKVYPDYYISNLPSLYPTTPFVFNHQYLTQPHLRQFLPPAPKRLGSRDPIQTLDRGIPNEEEGELWDKAVDFLTAHGGSLHPSLQLGNLFPLPQLNSICDRINAPSRLFPDRPSWFGDRISDDWGLLATGDIVEGAVLMRVPSSLFIRSHGLIQPREGLNTSPRRPSGNGADSNNAGGVVEWFGNRGRRGEGVRQDDEMVAREMKYQQRLDIIGLVQSALHLIGDSADIFSARDELTANEKNLNELKKALVAQGEENNDEEKNNTAAIRQKIDKVKAHQRKLNQLIDDSQVHDHYYKQVISQSLFLLLLRSLGDDYLLKPLLDILPDSYPVIDLLNDPQSMFTETNQPNNPTLTMDQFVQELWLPSLKKLTLKDIPTHFLDALGTILGTVAHLDQDTTLAELLFLYLKDGLGLVNPEDLLPQLMWSVNTVNQKLIQTLPRDPYNTKPLSSNFLYSPLHHGVIPMTELFRQSEQPNAIMSMASYLERDRDDEGSSDDFVDEVNPLIDEEYNQTNQQPSLFNHITNPQNPTITPQSVPKPITRRFKRIPYRYSEGDMEKELKNVLKNVGMDVDGGGKKKIGKNARDSGWGDLDDNNPHLDPSSPNFYDYDSFFFEIIATRDIKRGEEVTICTHQLKRLEMPIITPITERKIAHVLQNTDRLKELMRYSLCRVPQIVNDYQDQSYLYTNYAGELPLTHGVLPHLQLKSKAILLPPTHQTIMRELTPSHSYLANGFVSQYPTGINYRTSGKLHYQGNLNDLTSLDQLSPRDRKLIQYSEDSFPYLSYHDAPLKYIVPSYYDDFDLLDLFIDDRRYNVIYDAFFNPPGFMDRHQQFEMTWVGPNYPNLEAFYRFYMAPGFMAPHPERIGNIIQEYNKKKSGDGPRHRTDNGPLNRNHKNNNNNIDNIDEAEDNKAFTHKTSIEFVHDQFKNRFNYIADIAEANYKATHGIIDPDMELSPSQWIQAFSVKLDDENEECKFIGLYQSAVRLSERLSLKQNFRQLINAYEEVMLDPIPIINARELYQKELQSQGGLGGNNDDGEFYTPHPYDIAMSLNVKYNETALVSHITKVFASRLDLDGHHLLANDQVKRILQKNGVGDSNFTPPSSHQAQYHLTTQQQLQPLIDSHRERANGGLAIPPRWHCLDGFPLDRFNQYYQHQIFLQETNSSSTPWNSEAFLQSPVPFNPKTGKYQGSSTSMENAPRYRPFVP